METLQDVSWIRYLYTSVTLERFNEGSFRVVSVMVPDSSIHHNERYRYRMLFFEAVSASPVLAINLESDMMGLWCMSIQTGNSRTVLQHFDEAPGYDAFRALALVNAEKLPFLRLNQQKHRVNKVKPGLRTGKQ